MNVSIWVALISACVSVLSLAMTTFGSPALQRRRDARNLLRQYRDPLAAAAYELQGRLYNILRLGFIESYVRGEESGKREAAIETTMYVVAQYLGWQEIIRREVRYLEFAKDAETAKVGNLIREITRTFLSDSYGHQFMIWRTEQRGIGERMIVTTDDMSECRAYGSFLDSHQDLDVWLNPLRDHLQNLDERGRKRLTTLQHLLVDLVHHLDPKHKTSPSELTLV